MELRWSIEINVQGKQLEFVEIRPLSVARNRERYLIAGLVGTRSATETFWFTSRHVGGGRALYIIVDEISITLVNT